MRIPARDALWLRLYIIPHAGPEIKYAYRSSGQKHGEKTYSVGMGATLDDVTAGFKRHWAAWKGDATVVTRVYEKGPDGHWTYLARYEFNREKV